MQEEISRIRDLQYLLSLPGCLPPHKRGELGATYSEVHSLAASPPFCRCEGRVFTSSWILLQLVQAIQGELPEQLQAMQVASGQLGRSAASQYSPSDLTPALDSQGLGLRQGALEYQPGSSSGRRSELSDVIELPGRRTASTGRVASLRVRQELCQSLVMAGPEPHGSRALKMFQSALVLQEQCVKSIEELNSTFKRCAFLDF